MEVEGDGEGDTEVVVMGEGQTGREGCGGDGGGGDGGGGMEVEEMGRGIRRWRVWGEEGGEDGRERMGEGGG